MNEYKVTEHLHAYPSLARITLVALTGCNPDTSRMDQAAFREYFTKPVDLDRLNAFLARLK